MRPALNTNAASDHRPVQIVFNHRWVGRALLRRPNMGTRSNASLPIRITSIVPSNQSVTLTWESVLGQFYTAGSAASLGAKNAWTVLAKDILATNYLLTLQTNLGAEAHSFE